MRHNYWTGKGKHWDIPDNEIGRAGVKRINENQWFKLQQGFLRWLANSDAGRDLLRIPKEYGKITTICKNSVTFDNGFGQKISDFRPGAKWGNIARSHWKDMKEAYAIYQREAFSMPRWSPSMFPLVPDYRYSYATGTYYPDPDPESTTCDGFIQGYNSTWSTARGLTTANGTADAAGASTILELQQTGGNNYIRRIFHLFDTSGLTSGASISSATYQWYCTTINSNTDRGVAVVTTNPASNTNLVQADFNAAGKSRSALDSPTEGATRISFASLTTSAYNGNSLNATGLSWINKTGVSKFGLNEAEFDIDNVDPDNLSYASFIAADTAGTSTDPKLVVVYTVAGGGTTNQSPFMLMGVGM